MVIFYDNQGIMLNLKTLRNVATYNDKFKSENGLTISSGLNECFVYVLTKCFTIKQLQYNFANKYIESDVADLRKNILNPKSPVVSFQHIVDALHLVQANGDVVKIPFLHGDVDPDGIVCTNVTISDSLLNMVSSDDGSTIVFVSSDNYLWLLDSDYKLKCERIELNKLDCGASRFVNVGWGRAETQFRGKAGKLKTNAVDKTETPVTEEMDKSVYVAWNKNTSFAASYFCIVKNFRVIKLFNADGGFLYVTEEHGLLPPICWNPELPSIIGFQQVHDKQMVVLFESNALKFNEWIFDVDLKPTKVEWNKTADILLVFGQKKNSAIEFIICLTYKNAKWFAKKTLLFEDHVVLVQWDDTHHKRLHVILQSGVHRIYEWISDAATSQCECESNVSLVAVNHGDRITCTPFRLLGALPSSKYVSYRVEEQRAINDIFFATCRDKGTNSKERNEEITCNSMGLYLNDNTIVIMKNWKTIFENSEESSNTLELNLKYREPKEDLSSSQTNTFHFVFHGTNEDIKFETAYELSSFLWIRPNILYFNWAKKNANFFCVSHLDFENNVIKICRMFKMNQPILDIRSFKCNAVIFLNHGNRLVYHLKEAKMKRFDCNIPENCIQFLCFRDTPVTLTSLCNLFIGENKIRSDVVRMRWCSPFLVMVTVSKKIVILYERDDKTFGEILNQDIDVNSKLVTIFDDTVLIETDQGFVEQSRMQPLFIETMYNRFNDQHYEFITKYIAANRLNLNILFDHDPLNFASNFKSIVEANGNPRFIVKFLLALKDIDYAVKETPWKYERKINFSEIFAGKSKPSYIAEIVDNIMMEKDLDKYNSVVIVCAVLRNDLTRAVELAIRFQTLPRLFRIVKPNALFQHLLKDDQLNMAIEVADKANFEPTVYVPFIKSVRKLEKNIRMFEIHSHLEDHESAMKYLANCADDAAFDDLIKYVDKHKLHSSAYNVFLSKYDQIRGITSSVVNEKIKSDSVMHGNELNKKIKRRFIIISKSYGKILMKERKFLEAVIVFEHSGLLEEAFHCYLELNDWQNASFAIDRLGSIKKSDKKMYYEKIYNRLVIMNLHGDAAIVARYSLNDYEKSFHCYLKAKNFSAARNVAMYLKTAMQIFESHLMKSVEFYQNQFATDRTRVECFVNRLLVLREQRKEGNNQPEYMANFIDDTSSFSGSSSRTTSSRRTSNTARFHRRQEQLLWSVKEGNPREVEGIIKVIKHTIEHLSNCHAEIQEIYKTLLLSNKISLAKQFFDDHASLNSYYAKICDIVWPISDLKHPGGFQDILLKYPPRITSPLAAVH